MAGHMTPYRENAIWELNQIATELNEGIDALARLFRARQPQTDNFSHFTQVAITYAGRAWEMTDKALELANAGNPSNEVFDALLDVDTPMAPKVSGFIEESPRQSAIENVARCLLYMALLTQRTTSPNGTNDVEGEILVTAYNRILNAWLRMDRAVYFVKEDWVQHEHHETPA